jgi:hypothetical protein
LSIRGANSSAASAQILFFFLDINFLTRVHFGHGDYFGVIDNRYETLPLPDRGQNCARIQIDTQILNLVKAFQFLGADSSIKLLPHQLRIKYCEKKTLPAAAAAKAL